MPLCVLLAILLPAMAATAPLRPSPHPSTRPSPAGMPLSPEQLFSRRALRRARLLIQMRMLQLRDERLECVREAILRRLAPELRPDKSTTVTCRE
jgi:hypothetical protein